MSIDRERKLLELARRHVLEGEFTFSAGGRFQHFFDGRALTLSPEGSRLVGRMFWQAIAGLEVVAIGGPALGAAPIVTATQLTADRQGKAVHGFLVREEVKEHGAQKLVEGYLPLCHRVVIVEDTVSTGSSVFRAIEAANIAKCYIVQVIAILDWQLGGGDKLREEGYDFRPFLVGNIATGELSLWTPPRPL